MTALGNNVHIFARPHRREELIWCFDTVLGCRPVASIDHPGMPEPMLVVRFPDGGNLCIEFVEELMYGNLRKEQLVKRWEGETITIDITRKIPPGDRFYERYGK